MPVGARALDMGAEDAALDMRIDLDADGLDLRELPRFQRAATDGWMSARLALLTGLLAAGVFAGSWLPFFNASAFWAPLLRNCAAAFLLLSIGMQSACWIARWRTTAIAGPRDIELAGRLSSTHGSSHCRGTAMVANRAVARGCRSRAVTSATQRLAITAWCLCCSPLRLYGWSPAAGA